MPKISMNHILDRHNAVASTLHWSLYKQMNFEKAEYWWEHQPEPAMENEDYKLLYDFNIRTDKKISARRPDIVVVDKNERRTTLFDVACTWDKNVEDKDTEKINKYQDLKIDLQRIWETPVTVVPVVLGVLGAASNILNKCLLKLKINDIKVTTIQKTVLLKTANILRRYLGVSGIS